MLLKFIPTNNKLNLSIKLYFLIQLLICGCAYENKEATNNRCLVSNFNCLTGTKKVEIITSKGPFLVILYGKNAPLTSGNFLDLIKRKVYDRTSFHRVIKDPIPFVVMGGDPTTSKRSYPTKGIGLGSFIDPKTGKTRYIPLEIKMEEDIHPRYGEFITNENDLTKISLKNERGSIGMLRGQSPNSGSSQFYIALRKLPELDGRYSVFGKIIKGMEVIDSLEKGDEIIRAFIRN